MSIKHIILFIIIYVGGLALAIFGGCLFGVSLTCLSFELSVFFLIAGFSFLYWVPIYQRSRYIKILQNKYNAVAGNNGSDNKVKRSFFLIKHTISTQAKIFIGCFILSIIFALVPTAKWMDGNWVLHILDLLRTAMQFFAVDGGLGDLIKNTEGFYNCYVACLCVVAGVLFAYNIIIIFAKEFGAYMNYWVLHPFSAIYVMSELNERSVTLAESIMLKHQTSRNNKSSGMHWNPRFYFCDALHAEDNSSELISRAWQLGATVMKRDITELKIKLGSASNTFYFIGENEEQNINQAQRISDSYKKKYIKRKLRIYIYASRTESEMLIDDLNQQFFNIVKKENLKEYPLTIRRIDEHYRFALDFFWDHGASFFEPIQDNSKSIKIFRVGFVGFGEYAQELLKVLCGLGQLPLCRLIVYIFDKDAAMKMAKFQPELLYNRFNNSEKVCDITENIQEANSEELLNVKYHDKPFYELHFIECDMEKNEVIESCVDKKFSHMFFLMGNDKLNIDIATKISIAYFRHGLDLKPYAMVKNDETVAQLRREDSSFHKYYPHITVFGANCERYTYENIAEDRIEEVAKQVHKNYCINKVFAEIYNKVDSYRDDLQDHIYGGILKSFKMQLYSMKDEILREWRKFPDIQSEEIEKIIQDEKYNTILESLEKIKKNKGKAEQINIQEVITAIRNLQNNLLELWDIDVLDREFYKEEYFRRSSKARALFEKLLFELGFLCADKENKNIIICKNIVAEYVEDKDWALNQDKKKRYLPRNIPFYLTLERKSKEFTADYDKNYFDYIKNSEYKNLANCKFEAEHINSQWFEVNNLLQKRWIVFRWSEGYLKSEDDEIRNPRSISSKTHSYIMPYVKIYMDDYTRFRHTVYVYLPKEQDRNRLGYKISCLSG